MHGASLSKEYASELLLEDGWYGDNIDGLKVIFPTTIYNTHPNPDVAATGTENYWVDLRWLEMFDYYYTGVLPADGCGMLLTDPCSYDVDTLDAPATIIESLIQNEAQYVGY